MPRSRLPGSRLPALLNPDDLRGVNRLVIDAITGTTDLVEAVHASILGWPRRIVGLAPQPATGGIPGLVYAGIRGITRATGSGIDQVLRRLPLAPIDATMAMADRDAVLAILNGVIGDHLAATGNPLALDARLRQAGRALELERAALADAYPSPSPRLLVMVHGLCMNDLQWQQDGHHHGQRLVDELGGSLVHLHYNSGLPIAANGRRFSELLQQLVEAWPVEVERIAIVGHSMGGLVARAAIASAQTERSAWLERLDRLASLGTPHHGAPLERAGNLLQGVLGSHAHSAPFTALGRIRSAGIQDLRHGIRHAQHPPMPAHVRAHAVAASIQQPGAGRTARDVRGDGLVPVASAFGDHPDPRLDLRIPGERRLLVHGIGHIGLLRSTRVHAQLRDWLA
jgi:pimeloyl-ACP methyl ester carboxylesterase